MDQGGYDSEKKGTTMTRPYDADIIGARIKQIRVVFDLSQGQVGKICECGPTTVSNWEQGRQKPTIPQAMKLGDKLGLDLEFIYLGRLRQGPFDIARKLSADAQA